MSVHAGTILTVGGANVIDRLQSAGLGDVRVPIDTIREVGNEEVVDKIAQEPDFTFTMESLDVSTDMMAFLVGKTGAVASGSPPGGSDPDGTSYEWLNCEFVNVCSPWKDHATGSAGHIVAGHLVPGYYPTRISYQFGITDNAAQTVELAGGSFYYAAAAPLEEYFTGDNSTVAFVTAHPAVGHRKGGGASSDYRFVFGVIVNGVLQIEGTDYTVSGSDINTPAAATITFTTAPATSARIRFTYFTNASTSYAQATHADVVVKPGAVRGRNILVYLGSGGGRARMPSVQSISLEATQESEVERQMGSDEIVGRTINGVDCTGAVTVRSKDAAAFIALMSKVLGVQTDEVFGFFNEGFTIPLTIQIQNPKTHDIIKTLVVDDAKFQPPGTPARVNTPTDFAFNWDSIDGTFREVKGAYTS